MSDPCWPPPIEHGDVVISPWKEMFPESADAVPAIAAKPVAIRAFKTSFFMALKPIYVGGKNDEGGGLADRPRACNRIRPERASGC
ncbi:hypothetical protein D3C72_1751000 [compost metagenome]